MATGTAAATTQAYPMASLYVGDLHPEVTEAMLFDKFTSAGPVISIRVCRDMITRRSLGYAYVNFQQPADAERALDTMNFDLIRGRPIRIMWSQRDPALRKSGVGNVFIKNLDKNIDTKSLYDTFSAFGNILSCKIMTDENNQSKGFGFVHFETQDSADSAINKVNGMLLADKKVFVGPFKSRSQRNGPDGPRKFTNVFLKNFGDQLDTEKLQELCSQHGKIASCVAVVDENGQSKGFGFCSFETPEEAEAAVAGLNGYKLGDKALYAARFQKKAERLAETKRRREAVLLERRAKYQGVNLYIKNLDDTIDDDRLMKEFSKFGTITSAKVMLENGHSKGFGFVCFSAPDEATKAVTEMNGSIVGTKPLYVALAQRKEDRRMHLENQHMQRMVPGRGQHPMQLPYPNGMGGMVPFMSAALGAAPGRPYYTTAPMAAYRPTPRWGNPSGTPGAAGMRPQPGAQMYPNMAMQQSGMGVSAQQRGVGIPNMGPRAGTQMGIRASAMPGQMIPGNVARPQVNAQLGASYTQTARNLPANTQAGYRSSIIVPGQEPLTPAALANASQQEQKQMLGERLYPLIQQVHPQLAGKITGMLLEIDNTELLHMLESPESLKAKIEEATAVLQAHHAQQLNAARQAATNSAAP